MTGEFSAWLAKYGLTESFTTPAGDAFYVNISKKFGVLRKNGEYGIQSFYLDDILEFQTYDDENLVAEWNAYRSWRIPERNTRYSTNEVYMTLRLKDGKTIRIQLFRATGGNIQRNSPQHVNLIEYARQISQVVYNCAAAARQPQP
ncbi:MAG: hypothetical protein E7438_01115 [Ruminococcaceae bacterium]|nr:hypothetical protein [Oscillospiraceae bacterium]